VCADDEAGFVIGSAVYMFHWLKEAAKFVRRQRTVLAARPVWLFSSGPLGTDTVDEQGRDVREVAQAKETGGLRDMVGARDHAMFFGAWENAKPIGLTERFVARMPAASAPPRENMMAQSSLKKSAM